MNISVDIEGKHAVRCEPIEPGYARFHLIHTRGDRHSPLHRALLSTVGVRAAPSEPARPCDNSVVRHSGRIALVVRDQHGRERTLAELEFDRPTEGAAASRPRPTVRYQLSAFECRYLAEYGQLHPIAEGPVPESRLRTDLHTHFTGCVSGEALVELAATHDLSYPAALLTEAGIHADADADTRLSALSPPILQTLARQLEVPTERRITFLEMERIYRLRGAMTKAPPLFVPLLARIAQDYAEMGVDYAELSFGPITRADRLRAVHQALPAIEARTGVRLRFLAAMSRHDDLEWDLDYMARLEQLALSPYLVGVDFMGHETNSTRAFAQQLEQVADWAHTARPGFVIRVHAGENPAHPENVRIVLDCIGERDVTLRIGHGLYGVDDATVDRLAKIGTIVEFNLNSNFALNNIQSVSEAPIHRYLRAGVSAVLGTDGYGIYRSRPDLEARAAWLCGVTSDDFERMRQSETAYVAMRDARDGECTRDDFEVPDDPAPVHFLGGVTGRRARERAETDRRLRARLRELGAELLDRDSIATLLAGRRCISVAGAWNKSWNALPLDQQRQVQKLLDELFDLLDPTTDIVLTGGTCLGVEAAVAKRARRRGLPHVGVLVATTPPDTLAPDTITHAFVAGHTLHDKAAVLYPLMRQAQGLCLFIGGGAIVSDEIQTARNLRLRYLLMNGPVGASSEHAHLEPQRAFSTAAEVLAVLDGASECAGAGSAHGFRHPGVNPTVDVVVTRRNPTTWAQELLLIRREIDATAEAGSWALPGGFVATHAPPGQPWQPDAETDASAALRQLYEETGIDLRQREHQLIAVGSYQGAGRDPRDHEHAWSRSAAFRIAMPEDLAGAPIAGGDDASDAGWYRLDALPLRLAFDHSRIIADALERS